MILNVIVMANKEIKYQFKYSDQCNMCGAPAHKIIGKRLNQSQGKSPKNKVGITTTICKCTKCGLIYSNPLPIPADLQDHYGMPPENYWKPEYFVVNEIDFKGVIDKTKEWICYKPGMKSLDVGAGIGKSIIAFTNAGFDAYGFEASKPFYERAISKMGVNPEKIQLGMVETVNYPENYFDVITMKAVLEHFYDPSDSIQKALKWLKPNGVIKIDVPSSNWLISKLMNFYYKLRRTDYVSNLSPMHEPYHLYEFGLKSFQEHGKLNGYEVIDYNYNVCETFMPKFADRILKPYMRRTNTGMDLNVWIRKKEYREINYEL
jgi:ubiquinone/menaquinone biosynthesis C-methylase UbiE